MRKDKTKKREARSVPPMAPPRSHRAAIACALATLALLGADVGSKLWAEDSLSAGRFGEPLTACDPDAEGHVVMQRIPTEPLVLIDGYLELRYAENCGAAFGFMRSGSTIARILFVVAALGASIALFVMFLRGRGRTLFAISVPLIASGALGNLIDRIRYGYVVDFIKFDIPDLINYPTFNIADCGITIGVILLVLDGFREPAPQESSRQAAPMTDGEGG